jgi:hypothetical protein
MSRTDLVRFFTMHAENDQRAAGKVVRGRFGTGKSAAFGIGESLQVATVKDGLRNVVELNRADIAAARDGKAFEVRHLVIDEATDDPTGTTITVGGIPQRPKDVGETVKYIEKRLGRFRQAHVVSVNNHLVEQEEQPYTDERLFERSIGPLTAGSTKPLRLTIRISPTPLSSESNGVDILSQGIWHELTLAGLERAEHADYLFGFVDVPSLEDDAGPIPAFDNTRSGRLNPANPLVAELYAWIAESLENVRQDLIRRDRERRRSAEARRLQQEADRIAEVLNRDFDQWRSDFRKAAGRIGGDVGHYGPTGGAQGVVLPGDGDEASQLEMSGPQRGDGRRGTGAGREGDEARPGSGLRPGQATGAPTGDDGEGRRRRRGGFAIAYEHATEGEERSRYDEESRAIFINLDHPQIAAAAKEGIDSRPFRQLSYEVAFAEYALALPMDMAQAQGAIFDAQDAIFEARLTLSRITRQAASLYRD